MVVSRVKETNKGCSSSLGPAIVGTVTPLRVAGTRRRCMEPARAGMWSWAFQSEPQSQWVTFREG